MDTVWTGAGDVCREGGVLMCPGLLRGSACAAHTFLSGSDTLVGDGGREKVLLRPAWGDATDGCWAGLCLAAAAAAMAGDVPGFRVVCGLRLGEAWAVWLCFGCALTLQVAASSNTASESWT